MQNQKNNSESPLDDDPTEMVQYRERGYEWAGLTAEPYNHYYFDYQWMVLVTDRKRGEQAILLVIARTAEEASTLALKKYMFYSDDIQPPISEKE